MSSFHLQIVTPDGLFYDGEAESISVRAVTGNLTILPRHINFVTPLGMGAAKVVTNGQPRMAACIGGMLAVTDGQVRVIHVRVGRADRCRARTARTRTRAAEVGRAGSAQQAGAGVGRGRVEARSRPDKPCQSAVK